MFHLAVFKKSDKAIFSLREMLLCPMSHALRPPLTSTTAAIGNSQEAKGTWSHPSNGCKLL